jgi:thiol-disulfide isomerase/thioredoxin
VQNSAALELTTAGFEETVRTNDLVLVDFFAPWCGFCTRLAPEWSLLAERTVDRCV